MTSLQTVLLLLFAAFQGLVHISEFPDHRHRKLIIMVVDHRSNIGEGRF